MSEQEMTRWSTLVTAAGAAANWEALCAKNIVCAAITRQTGGIRPWLISLYSPIRT